MKTLLRNIGQLATCPARSPQHDAGLISDAAVIIEGDKVSWCGPELHAPTQEPDATVIDCQGGLLIPGMVDCHTHLVFGGWRGDEFARRLEGASYQDIAASGGGIRSTVQKTRESSTQTLTERAEQVLDEMMSLGVTTVEAKSGYGLSTEQEIRQLEICKALNDRHPIRVIPTFLGAHTVPPEFDGQPDGYVDLVVDEMLPLIADRRLAQFCDAFVETGAFTAEQGRRIFQRASQLGLGLKLHADQLSDGDGARLAAELGAVSAEHLEYANDEGITAMAKSGTVAVSLPLASLYLREPYLNARRFLDTGVPVAIATDFNPGSAPSYHLPMAMMLACLNQDMTTEEALMGVTTIAARAVAADDQIGSVAPGYQADLALIAAPDLNQWLYHFQPNACRATWKSGQLAASVF